MEESKMDKEKVYIAITCQEQIAKISEIIYNQFTPIDLKIDRDRYFEIIKQLSEIEKTLGYSYSDLVTRT